jgi:hypothetical protein
MEAMTRGDLGPPLDRSELGGTLKLIADFGDEQLKIA